MSPARELVALRSINAAYEPDGGLAEDSLRQRPTVAKSFLNVPERLTEMDVVETHEGEVAWGGNLQAEYGHFLVESAARLWALVPGAELEGLPVVFQEPRDWPFAREWLDAFGAELIFPPELGAVRFKRMFVPEQAVRWSARLTPWITPELRDIHLHVRRNLDVPSLPRQDVVWLSRRRLRRARTAYDEGLLEWILGDHVTTVTPETMPLAEQIGRLEASRVAVGVCGSAFHTMLMTETAPECVHLYCPSFAGDPVIAQYMLLDGNPIFVEALAPMLQAPRVRRNAFVFPGGHRLLIPTVLRALNETVLRRLFDDTRIKAFANPERRRHRFDDEIDAAAVQVLRDPLSASQRTRLGHLFEERDLHHCAAEQFTAAADLDDNDDARHRAAGARGRS